MYWLICLPIILFQGCILNINTYFCPPPLLDLYFFPKWNFNIMTGCAPEGKNFQPFLCNFVNFKSIGEKICIMFTYMHFPPFFNSLSIFFFPSLLFGHIFAGCQTEKYTPLSYPLGEVDRHQQDSEGADGPSWDRGTRDSRRKRGNPGGRGFGREGCFQGKTTQNLYSIFCHWPIILCFLCV